MRWQFTIKTCLASVGLFGIGLVLAMNAAAPGGNALLIFITASGAFFSASVGALCGESLKGFAWGAIGSLMFVLLAE